MDYRTAQTFLNAITELKELSVRVARLAELVTSLEGRIGAIEDGTRQRHVDGRSKRRESSELRQP